MVERLKDVLCGWAEEKGMESWETGTMSQEWQLRLSPTAHQIPVRPKQAHSSIIFCVIRMCLIRTYFFLFPIPQNRYFYSRSWLIFEIHPSSSSINPLVPMSFWVLVFPLTCQDNSWWVFFVFSILFPKPFPPTPLSQPSVCTMVWFLC